MQFPYNDINILLCKGTMLGMGLYILSKCAKIILQDEPDIENFGWLSYQVRKNNNRLKLETDNPQTTIILNHIENNINENTDALIPKRATIESAGWDLYNNIDVNIDAGTRQLISTGLSVHNIPKGYYLRIAPRSGLACKGIDIGAGVID